MACFSPVSPVVFVLILSWLLALGALLLDRRGNGCWRFVAFHKSTDVCSLLRILHKRDISVSHIESVDGELPNRS